MMPGLMSLNKKLLNINMKNWEDIAKYENKFFRTSGQLAEAGI